MPKPVSNGLCPGCEDPAPPDFEDAAGRPWHREHALKALADHFRTPLSPVDATKAVSFECEGKRFQAPHSFHLREIVFLDDSEISGVFIGNLNMVIAYLDGGSIRPRDLPDRTIVIDHDVPLGLLVQIGAVNDRFRWKLVGERRPEKDRPRPASRTILAVAPIRCEEVPPGGTAKTSFTMPCAFRGDRVVVDDWKGWTVVAVRLGGDPGRAIVDEQPLTGPSTPMPTYTAKIGELVEYEMRNKAGIPRRFVGRVYGTSSWG